MPDHEAASGPPRLTDAEARPRGERDKVTEELGAAFG